ncbi:hypothetical protein KBC04_01025 [Candidatus Babeliales bacterium]|nr:hypothetical protein [Candidatus Babeliales bacterium]MBP9843682.1 hypothetical protein [Candidatus Babeliales bacterium]
MQKIMRSIILFFSLSLMSRDCNLVIIIDSLQQETAKTEEVNMTHQSVTALQQKSSAVLMSIGLWKNIIDRKKNFEKDLQDSSSLASTIFAMFQATNQELKKMGYNIIVANQKLSHAWFFENYPKLAELSQDVLNQLRFDFLCYTFNFNMNEWRVYNPHTGMLLFVPVELGYSVEEKFEVKNLDDFLKHTDKKSQVVQSLQKLLPQTQDRFVIYCTGHGHPKSAKQDANISGLKIEEFKDLLVYFHEKMSLKLLVYASCYGGGVHTIEPYAHLSLHYPVIVTALTDAPIFGFGLFEGVKLPPYDDQFKLEVGDVTKNTGLLPYAMQDYQSFFKRAWKGFFDLYLIQFVSRFFACDLMQCHVQKVENFPLIRKAGGLVFTPVKNGLIFKLVQQVTVPHSIVSSNKPLLLYTKKIKKIKIDRAVPIVSMLPGIVSHEIGELFAPQVSLSLLISQGFLSLQDMQAYKNFMIKKLVCYNDVLEDKKIETFSHVLILGQASLMPKFLSKRSDTLIYAIVGKIHYLFLWNDQKISEVMMLDEDQIKLMADIENFVELSIDYQNDSSPMENLTFDAYIENKRYQQEIVYDCVKAKVCRKV